MDKQSKRIEDFIKKASRQVSFNNGQMKEKEKKFSSKSMYVKDDTTSRMVKVDSKELNIVDNNGSAEVTKSSYKFLFITSDEYSVCITEDMYKDIIKDK